MKIQPPVTPAPSAPEPRISKEMDAQLREVSKSFESILVNQMLTVMRSTVSKDGIVPESHAEQMYESMLDSEHSKVLSETGDLGIARMVYEHLLRTMPGG